MVKKDFVVSRYMCVCFFQSEPKATTSDATGCIAMLQQRHELRGRSVSGIRQNVLRGADAFVFDVQAIVSNCLSEGCDGNREA